MTATIQIEEGKYYRRADGSVRGPARRVEQDAGVYKWALGGGATGLYTDDGHYYADQRQHAFDFVAEAPDPDTHAVETVEGPQIADTPEWAKNVEAEASVEYAVPAWRAWRRLHHFGEHDYSSDITAEGVAEIRRRAAPYIDNADLVQIDPVDIKTTIADEAKRIVSGARRSAYGKPEQNFERISAFWTAYAKAKGWPIEFTAADVSPMMRLMKEARLVESPGHYDSFVDLVGYTLTGAEVNGVTKPLA